MKDAYDLMKTQRNEVLDVLRDAELNPDEFAWTKITLEEIPMGADKGIVSCLVHRPTDYRFEFDVRHKRQFWGKFSPGRESRQDYEEIYSWEAMLGVVGIWALCLKRELDAPDLWNEIQRERKLLQSTIDAAGDDSFTNKEQGQIRDELLQIKQYIVEQVESGRELRAYVEERFDYLEAALSRMSRTDWLHTAIGVIVTVAVGVGLTADEARTLFSRVRGLFVKGLELLQSLG